LVAFPLSPEERRLRARLAAYSMHAAGKTNTAAATAASEARWAKQVDPDGVLSPDERDKRIRAAKKAHFTRLAFLSAKARRRKAEAS
jgi:hypothetical protein